MKNKLIVLVYCIALFFFLGRELNPLDFHFFTVHDNTQVARLSEFAFNLRNGVIPPRLAPHFSFNHGFPVFNFYAPFCYWIGGVLSVIVSPAIALKVLFLGGLLISFLSMFLLISTLFSFWAGILSAIVYSTSLWMAVEIFVRGNVGEIWFMALFPLALYFLKKNDVQKKGSLFLLTCISLSFLFTVHNILSLVSVGFIIVYVLFLQHKKRAFFCILFGLLLASYFILPAVLENKLTYANEIASKTKYTDHFLCVWQLWKANKWGYGGSGVGCVNDDISFQIGKIHIILAGVGAGIGIALYMLRKKRKAQSLSIFLFFFTLFSAVLTVTLSKSFWDLFSPIMSLFQFPWRFLPFVLFGCAYFSAFIPHFILNKKIQTVVVILLSITLLFTSQKFFSKPWKYSLDEYSSLFLTEKYINKKAAYEIPEYFPRTGDYKTWRLYDTSEKGFYTNPLIYKVNTSFYKELSTDLNEITLPIHYFPFWEVIINGNPITPVVFDKLGRPILTDLSAHSVVVVRYNETPVEKAGNLLTIVTFLALVCVCINKKLWKKMNTILQ